MKRSQALSLNLIGGLLLLPLTGCIPLVIGAAAGVAGVTYVNGVLTRNVDEPVDKVHNAALNGMKDLGYFVLSDELNKHSAVINAETEGGQAIRIDVEALTEYVSEVRVRVGAFGDQDISEEIMDVIESKL